MTETTVSPAAEPKPMLINWPAVMVLITVPMALIALLIVYGRAYGFSWGFFALLVVGYYGSNIAVGVGLHRYFAHGAFKLRPWVEWVMLFFTAGTLQGPVMAWVSDHSRHHSFTDKARDPHSPLRYRSRWAGFFWAHMGWMLVKEGENKSIDRATIVKFGRNKRVLWQMAHYWKLAALMNLGVPALLGLALFGWTNDALYAAATGVLAIGAGRALQQQITFFVNSLCHVTGPKPYVVGTAGDVWWLAPLLLGENWHNFHHAFARDYRNGHRWYHMDVHKWIIAAMARLGLAYDLVITEPERVAAKMAETDRRVRDARTGLAPRLVELRQRLEHATTAAHDILGHMRGRAVRAATTARESFSHARDGASDRWHAMREAGGQRLGEAHDRLHQLLDEAQKEIQDARARLATLSDDARARVSASKEDLIHAAYEAQVALNHVIHSLHGRQPVPVTARAQSRRR